MTKFSLYLIRHGIAADRGTYDNDGDRPLTDEGRKKTRKIAKKLTDLGLKFDLILTSPLVRAKQTSDIFADLGYPVQTSPLLAPEGSFEEWLQWFDDWQQEIKADPNAPANISLGLIGHEPDLSLWAELLICGDSLGALVLKKAGVIGLVIADPTKPVGSSLLFMLVPPKLLL